LLLVCVLGAAACGARAETTLPGSTPELLPPTPPARLVIPAPEAPTLPEVEPPAAPPAAPATPPRPNNPRPTPPPANPAPPPVTVETPPPAVLSTSMNTADFERRIQNQLRLATTHLRQVNPRTLSAEAKAQYDAAQGFVRQCEEALKVRNLMFASQLADKAATMAALLRK
jgi:hypothetical protein